VVRAYRGHRLIGKVTIPPASPPGPAAGASAIAKPHVGPVPQGRSPRRPGTTTALLPIRPLPAQRRLTGPGEHHTGTSDDRRPGARYRPPRDTRTRYSE
jgi:hypothetical protein